MAEKKYADDLPCPLCHRQGKVYIDEIVQDLISGEIHVGMRCDFEDCSFLARIPA